MRYELPLQVFVPSSYSIFRLHFVGVDDRGNYLWHHRSNYCVRFVLVVCHPFSTDTLCGVEEGSRGGGAGKGHTQEE